MMGFSELKEFTLSFLDSLYPPICAGCGKELLGQESPICEDCMHGIPMFTPPVCPQCGAPLPQPLDPRKTRCHFCPEGVLFFDCARSVFSYKDNRVKNMIHALKFDFQTRVASPLSLFLFRGFSLFYPNESFDALVPVPLHKSRLRQREFNQATLLCRSIHEKTGIPIRENLVFRIRRTPPQYSLNPQERRQNLEQAFISAEENTARGLRILVVDDVMTTGATINAVSAVLRAAGARSISALTLAQTIHFPND